MSVLQHKVIDPRENSIITWQGFRALDIADEPVQIAVVFIEGDYECWSLDGTAEAIEELRKYYADAGWTPTIRVFDPAP